PGPTFPPQAQGHERSPVMSGTTPLRAVGYCRTSSTSQKDNTSLPEQRQAITRFCEAQGWALARFYVDESRSGAKIAGRDAFQAMMRDAAGGGFNAIVIFDIGPFDTRDRRRVLTNFVLAGVSEADRLGILERTKLGKIARAKPPLSEDPVNGH